MSILKVARMGHPILRTPTKPVPQPEIAGAAIQSLIDDMIETMIEYNGVGLAAPQVRENLRIFVAQVDADNEEDEEGPGTTERRTASESSVIVIINPEIMPVGRRMVEDWEGCLSVPDLRGRVQRHRDIKMRAFNREGQRLEIEATGYVARVMQHEADHLDGVLFLDRMKTLQSLSFIDEYVKYHAERE